MQKFAGSLVTLVGICLVVLTSCGGTDLTYVWKDPRYGGGYLSSVLVVGVSEDVARRRLFEEVFVREFEKRGIKAVASIKALGPDTRLTRATVKAEADRLGVDGVLATRLVSAREEDVYQPPSVSTMPEDYARTLDMYFYGVGAYSAYPGARAQHYVLRLQTNVFDTDTEKLIWTVSSQTIEPESVREIIESLCKHVMARLQKDQLIR